MRVRRGAVVDRRRRVADLVIVLPGMVLAAPILAITAVIVRKTMGAPVIFRQERAGCGGSPFMLLKFRTMTVRYGDALDPADDAVRLTPVGARLRQLSLDELPQLWNVLRGDMSLVGPRPLPMVYVARYSETQRQRLLVRPGITGLAQISGRNALSWEDKFALDVDYLNRRSVKVDLAILLRTVSSVLRRDGIAAAGEATMTEFHGGGRTS